MKGTVKLLNKLIPVLVSSVLASSVIGLLNFAFNVILLLLGIWGSVALRTNSVRKHFEHYVVVYAVNHDDSSLIALTLLAPT